MPARLADVAKKAGVSITTVSRVLNDKTMEAIPQSTIDRVKRTAQELGYRPNASARALVSRKTYTIGLLTPNRRELSDPHFTQMLVAVEARTRALGYHLVLTSELEGILGEGRVDGVLSLSRPDDIQLKSLLADTVTVFVFDIERPMTNCVSWSNSDGGYRAGEYLVGLGHRRIAILAGDPAFSYPGFPRFLGFRRAVEQANGECRVFSDALSQDEIENGYLLTCEILRKREGITAIFARHDALAVGALKALRRAGISVPQEMSVIGFFDTILARGADPSLTSVLTPIAQAGEIAVEELIRAIECGGGQFPGIMLPTSLTVRDSCAPPPSAPR